MVFGNLNKFSFIVDIVTEWSSKGFKAGLFYVSIDGHLFPEDLVNTTLNSELYVFFEKKRSSLFTCPIDLMLFSEDKCSVYQKMYYLAFPVQNDEKNEYIENNYMYSCGFTEMENQGYYLFSVSNGETIRILGAKVIYNALMVPINLEQDESIFEILLPVSTLNNMLFQLKHYYDEFILPLGTSPHTPIGQ